MNTTAELLSAYKVAQGITDTELARRIGADQSTVSAWVAGRRVPKDEWLSAISKAIGRPYDEVREATWYARRAKAGSAEEALALLTQLQTEVLRLRAEVDELRSLVLPQKPAGRGKRP